MNPLKLVYHPDRCLKERAVPIGTYDDEVASRVKLMFEIMYEFNGMGLAAPQVGWSVRLFVVNLTGTKGYERVFWNPSVGFAGDPILDEEGCLSLASIGGGVSRYPEVCLEADSPSGRVREVFTGRQARCIQHEMDHLNGLIILDRMEPRERARVLKEFARMGYRV